MAMTQSEKEIFMKAALDEARKGWGRTHPQPMIGAVLVENGKIVALRAGRGKFRLGAGPEQFPYACMCTAVMLVVVMTILRINIVKLVYIMYAVRNLQRSRPPQAESSGDKEQQTHKRGQKTAGLAPQIRLPLTPAAERCRQGVD